MARRHAGAASRQGRSAGKDLSDRNLLPQDRDAAEPPPHARTADQRRRDAGRCQGEAAVVHHRLLRIAHQLQHALRRRAGSVQGHGRRLMLARLLIASASLALLALQPVTGVPPVRLRGISAASDDVVWASGAKGTIVRTTDSGRTWARLSIPDTEALDFRDIDAIDARTAYALSIGPGEASRIY